MDRLTNFILADAVETGTTKPVAAGGGAGAGGGNGEGEGQPGAQQRHLGVVMIPGKHLVGVKRLGGT